VNDELLSRLRAYAAANPGDVKTICETVALMNAERRRERAKPEPSRTPTLRGLVAPLVYEVDEEPFLLTRRITSARTR